MQLDQSLDEVIRSLYVVHGAISAGAQLWRLPLYFFENSKKVPSTSASMASVFQNADSRRKISEVSSFLQGLSLWVVD